MSQQVPLVPEAALQRTESVAPNRKRKLDFTAAPVLDSNGKEINQAESPDESEPNAEEQNQKWQLVYDKINLSAGSNISGFVYKLNLNPLDDVCCQWVRKYGKFAVHLGPYRIGVGRKGAPPDPVSSDSFLAKKGLSILTADHLEALEQVIPLLLEELPHLTETLEKRKNMI